MEKSAIYHRIDSEYSYLYDSNTLHIRLRVKKDDIQSVTLYFEDPYRIYEHHALRQISMEKCATTDLFDYYLVAITNPPMRIQYGFKIEDKFGYCQWYSELGFRDFDISFLLENYQEFFKMPYLHDCDRYKSPEWVEDVVWYQIFPERFYHGGQEEADYHVRPWDPNVTPTPDDFFGGNLKGITEKLDYIQSLGVNGLYLCPIFESPSNHKYNTTNYFEIDPRFGTKDDFKELVDELHRRDMKIMLDAVFNHIGESSKEWQDVVINKKESPYYEWFHIRSFPINEHYPIEGQYYNYDTFAFEKKMPKLKTYHPEVKEYLYNVATYWTKEFNIDAWRLDVANEIDHQFWRGFYHRMRAINEDIYIIGEAWNNSYPWLEGDEFHSVMNYPLTQTIKDMFIYHNMDSQRGLQQIAMLRMNYRQSTNEVLFNLLDSHDTERILHACGENKDLMKQVLTFMFLQYGVPCIYYGTEVGVTGGGDPDCRRVMPWKEEEQDLELYHYLNQLIMFWRKHHLLINKGKRVEEVIDNDIIKIEISLCNQKLIAIFNNSSKDYSYMISDPYKIMLEQRYKNSMLKNNGFLIILE